MAAHERAHRGGGFGQVPLLLVGKALPAVEVDGSFGGVEDRCFQVVVTSSDEAVEVLRARHRGAICHAQQNFIAFAVQDLHVLVETDEQQRPGDCLRDTTASLQERDDCL